MLRFSILLVLALGVATHATVLPFPITELADEVCPVDSIPMANFEPEKFFNKETWIDVSGQKMGGVTCVAVVAGYHADSKTVTFMQIINVNGSEEIQFGTLTQDANSNAIYTYNGDETTYVQTILDTDYTTYGMLAQCQRGTYEGQVVNIVSRTSGKPANYDALVQKAKDAGYPTDKIVDIDTSGCSR